MSKHAANCRSAADAMQKHIDAKHQSADNMLALPPTRKRLQDGEGLRNDARRLERIQRTLRQLADMFEAGTAPSILTEFTSRAAVERAIWNPSSSVGAAKVRAMYDDADRPPSRAEILAKRSRELLMQRIPGFFPTPRDAAWELLDLVDGGSLPTGPGFQVLEPSAGTGALIDLLVERNPGLKLSYCEANHSLAEFLRLKYEDCGHVQLAGDFLEVRGAPFEPHGFFDLIVMNPPFENGQDVEHVTHAYNLLKPGGRLASIVSPAVEFREDRKYSRFRDRFAGDWTLERLPEGSFRSSGTGVNALMIRLEKPAASLEDFHRAAAKVVQADRNVLEAQACTLDYANRPGRLIDQGRQSIEDSPLWGGQRQMELF